MSDCNFDKAGRPTRRNLVDICWLLVLRCQVLDKKGPGNVKCLKAILTRQGSRREEALPNSIDYLPCEATCLTRRNSRTFSVGSSCWQGGTADVKKPRRIEPIAFYVMPCA